MMEHQARTTGGSLRVQIVSDLHFDVAPAELRLAPDVDVLVVAGDTCEGVERGFAWLRAAVPAPTPIITVAGNHEHYRHVLPDQLARGRTIAADRSITFLENDEAVIGGVRFLGCTLWTDFALRGKTWQLPDMAAARDGMNDYRCIIMSKKPWRRFLPRDALAMHVRSRAWLEQALATPFDGPTVVVTHHAPSPCSLSRVHQPSSLDACYASDLEALVASSGAALWIHGHTHHCCDYRLGDTRVVNNGHGYGGENRGSYDPALVVEITHERIGGGEAASGPGSTAP